MSVPCRYIGSCMSATLVADHEHLCIVEFIKNGCALYFITFSATI